MKSWLKDNEASDRPPVIVEGTSEGAEGQVIRLRSNALEIPLINLVPLSAIGLFWPRQDADSQILSCLEIAQFLLCPRFQTSGEAKPQVRF